MSVTQSIRPDPPLQQIIAKNAGKKKGEAEASPFMDFVRLLF